MFLTIVSEYQGYFKVIVFWMIFCLLWTANENVTFSCWFSVNTAICGVVSDRHVIQHNTYINVKYDGSCWKISVHFANSICLSYWEVRDEYQKDASKGSRVNKLSFDRNLGHQKSTASLSPSCCERPHPHPTRPRPTPALRTPLLLQRWAALWAELLWFRMDHARRQGAATLGSKPPAEVRRVLGFQLTYLIWC